MATRTNEAWLSDLRAEGERRSDPLDDLRSILHKGLPYALSRSGCWWSSYERSPTRTVPFLLLIKPSHRFTWKRRVFSNGHTTQFFPINFYRLPISIGSGRIHRLICSCRPGRIHTDLCLCALSAGCLRQHGAWIDLGNSRNSNKSFLVCASI